VANCESEYVLKRFKYYKNKKIKLKLISILCIIVLLLTLIFLYIYKVVNPIIFSYSESYVDRLITTSTNKAISKTGMSVDYSKFITIKYNDDDSVALILANTQYINNLSNEIATLTQSEIDNSKDLKIDIPIGTCSGLSFLTGKGSNFTFHINPIGNTICNFISQFQSSGINQTTHKIFIKITSEASLILPFGSKKISKEVEFLICESLIVGKIPSTYFGISNLKSFN